MEQLLTEVRVRDWVDAEDAQIQEDMNKVDRWKSRKFKVGENFQEYQGMIEAWLPGQLTQPGSDFKNLQKEVEDFNSDNTGVINTIRKQDWDKNLGTLEKAPTSLMDYPTFGWFGE